MDKHQCFECDRDIDENEIVWFNPFAQREILDAGTPMRSIALHPGVSRQEFDDAAPYHQECLEKLLK